MSTCALKAEASSKVGLLLPSHPGEAFSSLPPENLPDTFGFRMVNSGLVAVTYVKHKILIINSDECAQDGIGSIFILFKVCITRK